MSDVAAPLSVEVAPSYYVVLGMWVFSLVASPMWLEHCRFGPLEWCWRSLTYWKRQPMRLVVETAPERAIAATA